MNYYFKLFLLLAVPVGLGIGLIVTLKKGIAVGGASFLGIALFSVFVVQLLKLSHERQCQLIQEKQFKPNIRLAQWTLTTIALIILTAVPLLFVYTPLRQGVLNGNLPLLIIVFEILFFYVFFRAFRSLRNRSTIESVRDIRQEPIPLPSLSFFIISFVVAGTGVFISQFNKEVAFIIVVGSLLGYWIYQDFFARKRDEKENIMESDD